MQFLPETAVHNRLSRRIRCMGHLQLATVLTMRDGLSLPYKLAWAGGKLITLQGLADE
ncbi:MAG: hypothetical protein QOC89_4769, partial [Paraburkholderia sp.]|nr:hypothetical protein [Paraburkholderia sp.]